MLVNQPDLAILHVEALTNMNCNKLKSIPITIASAYRPCKSQLYISLHRNNLYTSRTTHNLYKPTVSHTYIKLGSNPCLVDQLFGMWSHLSASGLFPWYVSTFPIHCTDTSESISNNDTSWTDRELQRHFIRGGRAPAEEQCRLGRHAKRLLCYSPPHLSQIGEAMHSRITTILSMLSGPLAGNFSSVSPPTTNWPASCNLCFLPAKHPPYWHLTDEIQRKYDRLRGHLHPAIYLWRRATLLI